MTVRWKPLIVLSALFLLVAVAGLLSVTLDLFPRNAAEILPLARKEAKAGRFANAEIYFKQALDADARNARAHFELAQLYRDWLAKEPKERSRYESARRFALENAAKFGNDPEPRRQLLTEALANDDTGETLRWAGKLLEVVPNDATAHYALASVALSAAPADLANARTHLKPLATAEADRIRTLWLNIRLAQAAGDTANLNTLLEAARHRTRSEVQDFTDALALVRLRQVDALLTSQAGSLPPRLDAFAEEVEKLVNDSGTTPTLLSRLGRLITEVEKHQARTAASAGPDDVARLAKSVKQLEAIAEAGYQRALKSAESADLAIRQEYAQHLLERDDRAGCLKVVAEALKLPATKIAAWADTVALLHEAAIKAALSEPKDPNRFSLAEPHIKELIQAPSPVAQAVGHLFAGIVELERSGLIDAQRGVEVKADARLRASSLSHLKSAAEGLPDNATAQALYGLGLLLNGEQGLGRQYLVGALRLPNLDPRYQVWCAWAMLQAGYPEDAEPLVAKLVGGIQQGQVDRDLEPTLGLLTAEILQARRTPEDLRKARTLFEQARGASGGSPALELRLAQLDVLLGEPAKGLVRLDALRSRGEGGVAADHLTALILAEQQKPEEARRFLDAARARYPESGELAALDAMLLIRQQKYEEADHVLAAFQKRHPKDYDVLQMRARLLADALKRPDEARKILTEAAETADTSGPQVQLALLEINQGNAKAAAAAIAKVRARWKEAATPDLLDAQLAMSRNEIRTALAFLDSALKKDPSNKLALFWKAQLDDRAGATAEAARIYETLAREKPVKEIDDGLSLGTAANWALATLALENQDPDTAIARLEDLVKGGLASGLDRSVRWQLAAARSAHGQWSTARAEIDALLNDPKTTSEDRIRAANLFRLHGENDRAAHLLDTVLKAEPALASAVALRAYLLADKNPEQAATLLRGAIAAQKQPPSIHLMLAALENQVPGTEGPRKALAVIDQALKTTPDSIELIQARYRLLRVTGDPKAALAFVKQKADADSSGRVKRYYVDVLRDEGEFDQASQLVSQLLAAAPDDEALAEMLVRLTALRAGVAADRGDRGSEQTLLQETAGLIRRFRAQFPHSVVFPQAECELSARNGQLDRALALTKEIEKLDQNTPVAPMLRAQIATMRGWAEGAAREYTEAVNRAPRRADLRLALAQASLAAGKTDEAVKQASWVLEVAPDQNAAVLVKARALADQKTGSASQIQARRAEAVKLLQKALAEHPRFVAASHLIAEIQIQDQHREQALQTLAENLKANPEDAAGLAMLIQVRTEPRPNGQPPSIQDLKQADDDAQRFSAEDPTGSLAQAVSVGFHKAGQISRGITWAEKALSKRDEWAVHLNYGDLLMAQGEAMPDPAAARPVFERAVAEYDKVLKSQANSLEAVNNKAWVLTQYLQRPAEALTLAEGLLHRVDPSTLPPDFFDTLGAIHEALNHPREAEAAYLSGLKRSANHAALNFHLGRLLAADPSRASNASAYLARARTARQQLPASMATELDQLLARNTR